ncbi:hypothetical protein ACIRBX_03010 [Kitasatospora sp. NPDC096147]|uniref:hypothetical protein n=1 Tax=Kitasatospora sp. NPDC096147 TaxID=3364093 RepID=UPI00382066F0
MENSPWDRLPPQARIEADRLIAAGQHVRAIWWMRECSAAPKPGIHACLDLISERIPVVRGPVSPNPLAPDGR